jgi:hypothetical protein
LLDYIGLSQLRRVLEPPDQEAEAEAEAEAEEPLSEFRFPTFYPNNHTPDSEQPGADDMAGKQSCIGQLDVIHIKTVVNRLVTKLTELEEVVAAIKEDTKYSQAGAAVAAVSLVLALLYVAVVCGVAARNLGKARQEEVLRKHQESLDQAAESRQGAPEEKGEGRL